jgi:hypothetical protein
MSDKAPTRWSVLLGLVLKLRLVRVRLRILQIDVAILRKKIKLVQVTVASGSRPGVERESLARLAAAAEAISARMIPAMEQRYRKAVLAAVVPGGTEDYSARSADIERSASRGLFPPRPAAGQGRPRRDPR